MTYTIHHSDKTTECEYYWINPEQNALYYTMTVPPQGSKGNDIDKGCIPYNFVKEVTINEKQDGKETA